MTKQAIARATKPSPEQIIDDVWTDAEDAPGYDVRKALADAGYVIEQAGEVERLRRVMDDVACRLHAANRPDFRNSLRLECRDALWDALKIEASETSKDEPP